MRNVLSGRATRGEFAPVPLSFRLSWLSRTSSTVFIGVFCGPARLALTGRTPAFTLLKGPHGYFQLFSLAETLEKFRRKEISPVEVITAHLQRAQALQPKLNAFVHLDAESALARARQAEAAMQRGGAVAGADRHSAHGEVVY